MQQRSLLAPVAPNVCHLNGDVMENMTAVMGVMKSTVVSV